ncbi:single-stranded DNA endonuclease family protein isoform X2 [Tasmannia lanceolata]|uniref:single-stranded DNA endonuclease family protein isoform X2 n=1 Tax=Tasmannia lanceolata TaxID=3420 RepID=UPI004064863B
MDLFPLSNCLRIENVWDQVPRDELNSQRASSLPRNMGSEFSCMIKEAKALGMALGIPCLDGLEEAEAQCALLNSESLCDGCFTSDSDVFLFGARTVYRDIYLGDRGYVACYEMVDIERKLGFGRNSLITLALLLGSDYSQGVHGLGPETACRVVKSIGDDIVLHRVASEGLAFAKKTKGAKRQAHALKCNATKESGLDLKQDVIVNEQKLVSADQFLRVITAYLKPKCHSPDSAAVQSVVIPHPFKRTQLKQLCAQFFGWTPEKTDEYILPKIAERDLRRFANLRFTSSELGVRIPCDKMPVTCPVSAIIKNRRVQGRECFEVSWEEVDGLKTSVVPADLVESACPEKIAEFMERKAQGKKQTRKSRPKKLENRTSVEGIDRQLHGLLLSIESQSSETHNASPYYPSTPSPESEDTHTAAFCPLSDLTNIPTEVIDLSTPLPPLRSCEVTNCQQPVGRQIDVIDVSDSETEVSPEHERRARELRLFLDSIKDDFS